MECRFAEQRLQALIDGELSPEERAELESHLSSCTACTEALGELRKVNELGRLIYSDARFHRPGFLQKVLEQLDRRRSKPASGVVERLFAGYEILERIGGGAMGSVYKARQLSLDRIVALKILPQSLAQDKEFAERFLNEARASAKLNHPNIVRGIDAGRAGNTFYFAMEYVDGRPLRDLIHEKGRLSEAEAIDICIQIAKALVHASEAGLIHRDIKPANILVTKDGVAKLCDLGLARPVKSDAHLTQEGMVVGTPHYIAPEQARGETDLDARVDIYSLGATLYTMLTGQVPFDGPTSAVVMAKHVQEPFPDPRRLAPDLSDGIVSVLFKMVAKDRRDRFPDAKSLLEALEALKKGKPQEAPPPSTTARARRVRALRPASASAEWVRMALVGAGAAAAAVALYAFLSGKTQKSLPERKAPAPAVQTAEVPRAGRAESIVDALRARLREGRDAPDALLAQLKEAMPSLAGTLEEPSAKALMAELEAATAGASREYVERARTKAMELASKGRYDLALAKGGPLDPSGAPAQARPALEQLRDELFAKASHVLAERLAQFSSGAMGESQVLEGLPQELAELARPQLASRPAQAEAPKPSPEPAPTLAKRENAAANAAAELSREVNRLVAQGDLEAAKSLIARERLKTDNPYPQEALSREWAFLSDLEAARTAIISRLAALAESGAELKLRGRDGRELIKGRLTRIDPAAMKLWLVSSRAGAGTAESVVEIDRLDQSDLVALIREALKGKSERAVGAFLVLRGDLAAAEVAYRAAIAQGPEAEGQLKRLLDVKLLELSKAFKGKLTILEGNRLSVSYDFSDASQLEDWVEHALPGGTRPSVERTLTGEALKLRGLGGLRSKARFQGDVSVSFSVRLSRTLDGAAALLGLDDSKPGSFLAGIAGFDGKAFPERWSGAFPYLVGEPRALGTTNLRLTMERSGGKVLFKIEGLPEWSYPDTEIRTGSVALWSLGSEVVFDDVTITGTPDPEWLKTACAGGGEDRIATDILARTADPG